MLAPGAGDSAATLRVSDSTELPSAVVRGPILSYTGSALKAAAMAAIAASSRVGVGALDQLGARGRRGMVT